MSETWQEQFDEQFKYVLSEKDPDYGSENIREKSAIKEFIRSQVEKTRREAFREGQNSVHVEAQGTDGVVKLNVDYAKNAAQNYINRSQNEWHEMGFKAGLARAIELVPNENHVFDHGEEKVTCCRLTILENLKNEMKK